MSFPTPLQDSLDARPRLLHIMQNISDRCWCAGWLDSLAYDLWDMVRHDWKQAGYGIDRVTLLEIEEMRELSEKCGGWFDYDDGPEFYPTEQFTARRADRSWQTLTDIRKDRS